MAKKKDLDAKIDDLEYRLHRLEQEMGRLRHSSGIDLGSTVIKSPVGVEQPVLSPPDDGNIFWTPLGSAEPLNDRERRIADNHNLDDLRLRKDNSLVGFVCKGCGQQYTSIQDRTLRQVGPGGCDGCLMRMKWG